jgi:uncharacterized protein (TIGR02678 family)
MRMLLSYGVIRRVEGDETKFAESSATDCLYDIDKGLLTDTLYTPVTLGDKNHAASTLDERLWKFFPDQSEDVLRPRDLEHRLMRRLLDNPVTYFDDLTEREFQYWQSQRSRLLQVIEEAVGLVAEVRVEGVALLDPMGELTDAKMPDTGTVGHATLLIAEFLADHGKSARPSDTTGDRSASGSDAALTFSQTPITTVPVETLTAHLAKLARQHQSHWRKNVTDPAQTELVLNEVLDRLEMLRLVRRKDSSIQPLPAIHRFTVDGMDESS